MKSIKKIVTVVLLGALVSCNNQKGDVKTLKTEIDSVSYAIGLNMSKQLKTGFPEFNQDVFMQGVRNGKDSTNLLLQDKDLQMIIQTYFQKKQQEKMKEQQAEGEKNKKAGEDFLAENKDKEGVITTESGLQYIVLKEGTGKTPTKESRVKVNYHGTTIDGTVFDSSVDRGEPATFGVTEVIKGWTEGLLLMKEGAKYKFFIPQDLAYGSQARSAEITPYSTLIFELELLEVQEK